MVVVPISNGNHFQNKRFTSCGSVKSIVMYSCIWTVKLAMLIKPFRLHKSVYFPMAPISNMLSSQNIFWPNIYGVQGKLKNNKLKILKHNYTIRSSHTKIFKHTRFKYNNIEKTRPSLRPTYRPLRVCQ